MKLTKLLVVCCFFALVTATAVTVLVHTDVFGSRFANSQELPYHFIVNDTLGMDLGTDKMRLGTLKPGAASRRGFVIENAPIDSVVRIHARGDGSEYISFSRNDFVVESIPVSLEALVSVPHNASHGLYEGTIYVQIVNS